MSWFVVSLRYVASLDAIDQAMKAHVAFLEVHRRAGRFIAWGRKVPRDGGIIIACGESRTAIEAIMQEDPFVGGGLATVEVTEFAPKPAAMVDGVARLLGRKG
jgi:uncharacterized protein YciI